MKFTALLVSSFLFSAIAFASDYVSTTNPDQFTEGSAAEYFKNNSDTGKFSITECYRRIDDGVKLQIVCKGSIDILIFGGHPSKTKIACLHNFTVKNDKYMTLKAPQCTR